ncbi:arsenate reductase ArsC [Corallococcus exiguus]|uniref:Arsenate reductase ArsC n=1 Tax=Corallococcus exiguus TaxID=83462 RepID=A0A7Y1SF81_9BACT|nr:MULTISPECIES: arsenate reductase ArsC [Corallococcus]NBC38573.1 arsenate reductase ArsC [Corallococcus exiguus]NNC22479.1 arsenate reductase ArsC [Corallococcus exiguus]NRD59839.1 arsenate reductase ArsC [Corallococcus exiguus]NRD68834.1 arsenate reductase ArsC [Corallococcus exiguus]RKH17182.1 arsenate reductase ArsC [Corallococcus sp. CA041A]
MNTVIFACTHNAGRSQIAAAFFNLLADPAKARAISAGTQPAERLHPEVLATMKEMGVDLGDAKPQRLTPELANSAQILVTLGGLPDAPSVTDQKREDWPMEDTVGKSAADVEKIRDTTAAMVSDFVNRHGWERPA